jgi:hypothetical protein
LIAKGELYPTPPPARGNGKLTVDITLLCPFIIAQQLHNFFPFVD